nr:MAG TPA: hypothetical protein [Caudoviricetes sp.]
MYLSHLQTISNIISLSDPPEILHNIFLYLGLLIIAHALIRLSRIT